MDMKINCNPSLVKYLFPRHEFCDLNTFYSVNF